jgi:hypothetical protein
LIAFEEWQAFLKAHHGCEEDIICWLRCGRILGTTWNFEIKLPMRLGLHHFEVIHSRNNLSLLSGLLRMSTN